MELHEPKFTSTWFNEIFWDCSCGYECPKAENSWERVEVAAARHAFPHVDEPKHTPSYEEDEFGHWHWTCSCGKASPARGLLNDQRARQSHTRHTSSSLRGFYRSYRRRYEEKFVRERQQARHTRPTPSLEDLL